MRNLIAILLFVLVSVSFAGWNVTIKVTGKLSPETNTFTLRDSIESGVAANLDNAEVIFNIDHYEVTPDSSCWDVKIIINAKTKGATNIDTFSTTIYSYFQDKFGAGNGSVEIEYFKGIAF